MKLPSALVLVLAVCMSPEPPAGVTHDETGGLQGAWRIVLIERNGTTDAESRYNHGSLQFNGQRLVIRDGNDAENAPCEFRIDKNKRPNQIIMTHSGTGWKQDVPGIFRIDGDKLWICLRLGTDPPASFTTKAGSESMLLVLKKVRP